MLTWVGWLVPTPIVSRCRRPLELARAPGVPTSALPPQTILPETGDSPNRHDILTGSQADGTAADDGVLTCGNWTSSDAGSAQLGHHDRRGGGADPTSWNSAHASRGCSQSDAEHQR